jgi:hypothetical protein
MPKIDVEQVEAALQKEVQRLDKRVRVSGVELSKKKDTYRVTLLKDGKSTSADLQTDVIEQYLSQEGKNKGLKKALGKAVSHLSIRYTR